MASPILKWPGGKRTLTALLHQLYPNQEGDYYEPFLGGGAMFFTGKYERAHLSDVNEELINLYQVVKDHLPELIEELNTTYYSNTEERYYEIRGLDREETFTQLSAVKKAARILYLNRTCFNGLYRVNKAGHFNVPYGYPKNPTILNEQALTDAHNLLVNNTLTVECEPFSQALQNVQAGDLVYLDPPYIPLNPTSSFTSYAKDKFGKPEQEQLALTMKELDAKGAFVVCSNSYTPLTEEIYSDFIQLPVMMARRINSVGDKRQAVKEALIFGDNAYAQLEKFNSDVLDALRNNM